MRKFKFTIYCFLIFLLCWGQQKTYIIPEPKELEVNSGSFILSGFTSFIYPGSAETTASLFNEILFSNYGIQLKKGKTKINAVRLIEDNAMKSEEYQLIVNEDGVLIRGKEDGLFYGTQTLLQLISQNEEGVLTIPFVEINDEPRFTYRGVLVDVGRYFFSEDCIKRFIDRMAYYKLNTFHWHLTEDGGWRIEIKKYPELTQKGAWRSSSQKTHNPKDQDRIPHGGFYTQEQVKSIIKYAADRQVTIIPEIEMPGHSMAALAVFPELSCTGGPFSVPSVWGIKEDIFCAGNEKTFQFLEDVLSEIIELFPIEYIHIGGDEAPKTRWKNCEKCQARIHNEHLKDEHELQSYFIQRIEKFINSKGKKIIGWDEILEGGLAPNATVMSWRGESGGIEAANMGHEVIMSTNTYLYFDYYQSLNVDQEPINGRYLPLSKVYSYEPYTPQINPEQRKYIKGIQGNIWMENIPTENTMYYMAYPRTLALSEVAWSPANKKNYNSFLERLSIRLAEMDKNGILFRIPEPIGFFNPIIESGKVILNLLPPVNGAQIYYTTDDSDPSFFGKLYSGQLVLPLNLSGVQFKCVVELPSGRRSGIYDLTKN